MHRQQINELAFENWCKKHITDLLQPYEQKPEYKDLSQDCWLEAYQCLRVCQQKQLPVNYPIVKHRLEQTIARKNQEYKSGGITYSSGNDLDLENEVEIKVTDNVQPISSNIDKSLKLWLNGKI